jgi:hypothetical protein
MPVLTVSWGRTRHDRKAICQNPIGRCVHPTWATSRGLREKCVVLREVRKPRRFDGSQQIKRSRMCVVKTGFESDHSASWRKPGAWRIVPRAGGEVRTNFVCGVEGGGADMAGHKVVELDAQ